MQHQLGLGDYLSAARRELRGDAPIYEAIGLYLVVGLAFVMTRADFQPVNLALTGLNYLGVAIVQVGVSLPLLMLAIGGAQIVRRLGRDWRRGLPVLLRPRSAARYFAGALLAFTILFVFFATFTSVKQALPSGVGFPHDRVQADIDQILHFGVDPWRLTFLVAPHDWMRWLLEWNYHFVWFHFIYGALFIVAAGRLDRAERRRYLVGYILLWVICGNIIAGIFLSGGPAFYGLITGDMERFAEQLAFLRGIGEYPSLTLAYQAYLWSSHEQGLPGLATGISAFPSMHVALAAYNAMFIAERSRFWGAVCWAFVLVIMFSSVYLAWHYAIDGYASIALVALIYWLTRKYSGKLSPAITAISRPVPAA